MAVHIELAELDETREARTADGGQTVTATRISHDLGKRPVPAKVSLRLLLQFRTEPGADVSIVTDILSHTGESICSTSGSTRMPTTGKAHVAINLPVTFEEPGSYTVHCIVDDTPWSQIISLDSA